MGFARLIFVVQIMFLCGSAEARRKAADVGSGAVPALEATLIAAGWTMTSSYLANKTAAQITSEGTPKRFELPEATGLSDHWPLVMVIEK